MQSSPIHRDKILVVGRRGVGKLTLVQSILGSRIIPTTPASSARPTSPFILPAIPVPTLEELILEKHRVRPSTPPNEDNFQSDTQQETASTENNLVDETQLLSQVNLLDHSGITIPWKIDTKYYSVDVAFWIDETDPQGKSAMEQMVESGELDDLGSVVEAVVFCFSKNRPDTFYDVDPWVSFVERHETPITLCVNTDTSIPPEEAEQPEYMAEDDVEVVEDYADWCLLNGFEYIDLQDKPDPEYPLDHVGLDRLMEALAAHIWDGLKRKSQKKRRQHERSMKLSLQGDDVDMIDMDIDHSIGSHALSELHIDDDDDDDDDDEDEERAFMKAIMAFNKPPPSEQPSQEPSQVPSQGSDVGSDIHSRPKLEDGDEEEEDSFDYDSQELEALRKGELDIWTSEKLSSPRDDDSTSTSTASPSASSPLESSPINEALDQQFREFLGLPTDVTGSRQGGAEYKFKLEAGDEFEFGDYVTGTEGLPGEDTFGLDGEDDIPTPSQESIKSMHNALFANIDDEDGMDQAVATLQSLR
ncbi:hypothetical protein BGZ94_000803, partial [Podila epigama]